MSKRFEVVRKLLPYNLPLNSIKVKFLNDLIIDSQSYFYDGLVIISTRWYILGSSVEIMTLHENEIFHIETDTRLENWQNWYCSAVWHEFHRFSFWEIKRVRLKDTREMSFYGYQTSDMRDPRTHIVYIQTVYQSLITTLISHFRLYMQLTKVHIEYKLCIRSNLRKSRSRRTRVSKVNPSVLFRLNFLS